MTWPSPQEVAQSLGGAVRSGDEWTARCPVHDDKNPSFSVRAKPDGSLLVHCFAGCSQDDVVAALKERGLWDAADQRPIILSSSSDATRNWQIVLPVPVEVGAPDFETHCGAQPVAIFRYENSRGELLGYQCRIEQGGGKKRFLPLTYWRDSSSVGQWRAAGFPKPRPLYGLKQLADLPLALVLLVEGEKAADAAKKLFPDHAVVTWPNGANAVADADWSPLAGRDLVIWPDNDEPGIKAGRDVAVATENVGARRVRIVSPPPTLPPQWDLADELPHGLDLLEPISSARSFDKTLARFVISAREMRNLELPERRHIIFPFLPASGLAMAYSRRGLGKTWLGLTLGLSVARGENFLSYSVPQPGTVLYIDGEMSLVELRDRLRHLGGPETDNLLFLTSEHLSREGETININRPEDQVRIEQMLDRLERSGTRPDLIILDNLSSLGGGIDENDNSALDVQLRWLIKLRHRGCAVLMFHHAGKSGDQRGASRREDILDTTIKLEAPDDEMIAGQQGATFDLEFTKTRGIAPDPSKLRLSLRPDGAGTLEWQFVRAVKAKPHHLTLKRIWQGVHQSDGSTRGYFSQQELADGYLSKGAVSKHVAKLVAELLVVIEERRICITHEGVKFLAELFGVTVSADKEHIVEGPDEKEVP